MIQNTIYFSTIVFILNLYKKLFNLHQEIDVLLLNCS